MNRGTPTATRVVQREAKAIDPDSVDPWTVLNKDPQMAYFWARLDRPMDMVRHRMKGYAPALGAEQIVGVPYGQQQPKEGEEKRIGNRILMCCPKERAEAREKKRQRRHMDQARREAHDTANELQKDILKSGEKGLLVKALND